MGKADAAMERYLTDPTRYADLINGYCFQGRQILQADDVIEKDTRLSGSSDRKNKKGAKNKQKDHQKQRDIIRKIIFGAGVAVIALENQTLIHYAMPIRTLVEDALEYDQQLRAIRKNHRENNDLKNAAEFLGGFSAQDRLIPASTIVLYLGEEEWNGPRDLLDIIDLEHIPKEIRQIINGYPLHILEVRKFKDIDCFQTDLREVFGVIQNSSSVEELLTYTSKNQARLEYLEEDAYDVIAAVTGNVMLMEKKEDYRKGSDAVNLCKGMVEWAERERQAGLSAGRLEGRSEGRLEGRLEGIAEGRLEGIAEGRLEGIAESKFEIACNAFAMGLDNERVSVLCNVNLMQVQSWFEKWISSDMISVER